ncbi:hypothetical protein N7488_000556 [Penicillium malachiteum]|nr:hypothetical protein N7488_000556 [Penicillium malachiteum]
MKKPQFKILTSTSIIGLVVEFVVAIDEARVRFTDDAHFFFVFLFLFHSRVEATFFLLSLAIILNGEIQFYLPRVYFQIKQLEPNLFIRQ